MIGKTTKSSLLLLIFSLHAETGQLLPGEAGDLQFEGGQKGSPYLPNAVEVIDHDKNKAGKSSFLPGGGTPIEFEKEAVDVYGQKMANDTPGNMITVTQKEVLNRVRSRGNISFGLDYIYDNYTYTDTDNIFQQTFESSAGGSHKFGMLQFSATRFFNRKLIDFFWKVNLGIGYNRGPGYFSGTGEKSDTIFQLWTLPLDFLVGVDIPVGWSSVMVGIAAGPSVMGLIQSRDDYGTNEKGRRKRQYSFGYSYQLKASIDVSHFFTDTAYTLYDSYGISRCYFNLIARGHSYSGFQESDISINGISVGAGFTFEFI